jgi:hypothetical protein
MAEVGEAGTVNWVCVLSDSEVLGMTVTADGEGTVRKISRRAKNDINSEVWEKKKGRYK